MKQRLLTLFLLAFIAGDVHAQYPDLPGGGASFNVQTMPTGSYVIAMDNKYQGSGTGTFNTVVNNRNFNYTSGNPVITTTTNTTGILTGMEVTGQAAITAGTVVTAVTATTVTLSIAPTATQNNKALDFGNTVYSGADFNLKSYGLLITLLNSNTRLRWIIKPGKTGDGVDFSVNATRIRPSLTPPADLSFAGGPFVIFPADTTGVAALVQTYNGVASSDDVKMYVTNADVAVDVRYDYFFNGSVWKPKIAVLNDGGSTTIHTTYLQNAGVPAGNYSVEPSAAFITNCYTFASEPHNTASPNSVIQGIRTFVQNGSNFLAECAAVRTYELSSLARFQSTNGFDNANENGNPATWSYSNADMAYFQINGYFGIADGGGSLQDWVIPSAPTNPPVNNFYSYNTGAINGFNYTNASVSKLRPSNERGGLVFYLGSHSYSGSNDYNINGQRMYMNAIMVPTQPSLKTSAVSTCAAGANTNLTVNVTSTDGPSFSYPLSFSVYKDLAPLGYNAGDVIMGNIVVMTAPNVYQGGISQITVPLANFGHYVLVMTPTNGCKPNDILINCPTFTLAVGLTRFTASRKDFNVDLNWSTSSEQNCNGFRVERSVDNGSSWQTAGFVNTLAVNGTSSTLLSYTFRDPNNSKNVSQYRLRQVDLDGNEKLSEIRLVPGLGSGSEILVYPNPSPDGKFNIVIDDGNSVYDISVIDMSGRIVKKISGIKTGTVQIDKLETGVYILKLSKPGEGDQFVRKIVVN